MTLVNYNALLTATISRMNIYRAFYDSKLPNFGRQWIWLCLQMRLSKLSSATLNQIHVTNIFKFNNKNASVTS